MAEQQLFLLQLLKVPVIIIKTLSKVLSILTYLPNYIFLYIVDYVVFNEGWQENMKSYIASWLPRLILLVAGLSIFVLQFLFIFSLLQLEEHGLAIQIIAIILTLSGLLILMRKGYLEMIQKYNLTKLKSPREHLEIGLDFGIDLLGILLAVINGLMLINISKTVSYKYQKSVRFRFLIHIVNLIKQSWILYLQFFYIKIFFKIFPWRFIMQKSDYQKEKNQNNVLNCLVLLTLLYLATLLDVVVVIVFGLPLIIDFQRRKYYQKLCNSHLKWKITLVQFSFVSMRTLQLMSEIVFFLMSWADGKNAIKLLVTYESMNQLFGLQFWQLVIRGILKIPFQFCNAVIFVFRYKYYRKLMLLSVQIKTKPDDKLSPFIVELITFKCFGEFIGDSLFLPLIIGCTLIRPWRYKWLKFVLDSNYEMKRSTILKYAGLNIIDTISFPFVLVLALLIIIYQIKKPYRLYTQAGNTVDKLYLESINKQTSVNSVAPINVDIDLMSLERKSQLSQCLFLILDSIKKDWPHLPYFMLAKITFLNIYNPNVLPATTANLLHTIYRTYLYQYVKKSIRFPNYQQMLNRAKASGIVKTNLEEMKFWNIAYKCERLIKIQTVLKLFMPNRIALKVIGRIVKQESLSEISTQYWYQQRLCKALALMVVYLAVQLILSLIGVFFMLPLTLWRFPTFIKLFIVKKDKKQFFPILFKVYRQLLSDIMTLPLKFVALIMNPKMYLQYVKNTSFNYGPSGIQTFQIYQDTKWNYFMNSIVKINFVLIILHTEISLILLFWIRIKNLKFFLRRQKMTIFSLYKQYVFKRVQVPTMEQMITNDYDKLYYQRLQIIVNAIHQVFIDVLQDFPYLLLMLFIFITMPWRINYIMQAIKDLRKDSKERKLFYKLLKNIFQDYLCIFLNIILLFSGWKTKKALLLIRRNYRLNFFIGFLQYSYLKQLKTQMIKLGQIYVNILFFVLAVLFGWPRANQMVKQLFALRKKQKQTEEASVANKIIYDNTVKSGKQLQILSKMGYYNYLSVCSFLTIPQIINLRKADKFNYLMSKREEIWFTKWELSYAGKQNISSQSFENKCMIAYQNQTTEANGQLKVSYKIIIINHFKRSAFDDRVDITIFLKDRILPVTFDRIFKQYEYNIRQGYGPQNQLPQAQVQDQQFLRLTNQFRRQKIYYDQNNMYLNWLYQKPTEIIAQKLHRYFRIDDKRRRKQILSLLLIIGFILGYLQFIWIFWSSIFVLDCFIGIKIIFTFYFHTFCYLLCMRSSSLYTNWISLQPFDIYYDIVNFFLLVKHKFIEKFITPTVNLAQKCEKKIIQIATKVYKAITVLVQKIYKAFSDILKKVYNKIVYGVTVIKNFVAKYLQMLYQKVVKPLYIAIADKIRLLTDFSVKLFKAVFNSIKTSFIFIGKLFVNLYEAIREVFSNINRLYYFILLKSMNFLLKFGIIGNLIFTIFGLVIMTLPSLIWYFLYSERWYLIVSTIHTMVLIVMGYKHLNKIKSQKEA